MTTGIYAALFAFGLIALTFRVALLRMKHKVVLGAGENQELERNMRAHGNFVETVPMALVLMMILELNGALPWVIHWLGLLMIISRVSHFIGLTTGNGYGAYRTGGVFLTFAVYLIGGLLCLWSVFSPSILSLF